MKFSLTSFPEAFLPLIVVVGDRREVRPKTSGDLLAYSASTLDLLYLPKLQLPPNTLILSDKIFVIERPEIIRQLCKEVNILTIGSPAVNLFSRRINEYSVFKFDIEPQAKELMQRQYNIIENYKLDRIALSVYKAIVEQGATSTEDVIRYSHRHQGVPDERIDRLFGEISQKVRESGLENYRELLRKYEGRSLLDPVKAKGIDLLHPRPRGEVIGDYADFGLVSIAKHPFAETDDKVVIYVAGRHGPATARGVGLLAHKKQWAGRELGGIFEVQINTYESFSQRIQGAATQFDMPVYDVSQFTLSALERSFEKIRVFLSTPLRWADEENKESIVWLATTISDILSKEFGDGHCHHPHEPELAGKWSFVKGILKHFPPAKLIIHNVTGCSPGVMFEVGSSLGLGKNPVLFWDTSRIAFQQNKLPKLLQFTHVHPIRLADRAEAASTFAGIIPRVLRDEADELKDLPSGGTPNEGQVFLWSRQPKLRSELINNISKRGLTPKVESDMGAKGDLERVLEGVLQSVFVVVDVAEDDPDGIIVLGLARAKERKILELTRMGKAGCSMFDGLRKSWHQDTLADNVDQAVGELLRV